MKNKKYEVTLKRIDWLLGTIEVEAPSKAAARKIAMERAAEIEEWKSWDVDLGPKFDSIEEVK